MAPAAPKKQTPGQMVRLGVRLWSGQNPADLTIEPLTTKALQGWSGRSGQN